MIFPSNRVRVLVATQPVDFRKGHDGLCALVASTLRKDPYTGTVFVFRARRADRLKLLYWDDEEDQETVWGTVSPTNGLVMAYKRLEDTTFTWPAIKDGIMALNHAQFEALFSGLDWRKVKPVDPRPPSAPE
ncbi:IS66 family insertion sequence element accessory protein TnpB [Rhodobacteraceae bacterium 2376]|uniref:IS66 family insertion sequence element accessory protein TnpB n=1 Tax=Rhabdonatronobacter sediminivivens TaxID=2743469 RepID=A0A7Z0L056_9RHOB|nr:IS66 family insertion sequence element accessory protein TnpB [Rhabdonatronobacter sediminivivens]NYS26915.1 IS66 family insertion sequence element accessory protein TnpB [Rhabdonatronobacter sediminivivens]